MKVTSLFSLRQALREYLAAALPEVSVLAALPSVREPIPVDAALLVLGVKSLRRGEGFLSPADSGLLLEVGLTLTVCHRDSSETCEDVSGRLASLLLRADFPFRLLSLQSGEAEFNRTIGAFTLRTECALCCLLCEDGEGAAP